MKENKMIAKNFPGKNNFADPHVNAVLGRPIVNRPVQKASLQIKN